MDHLEPWNMFTNDFMVPDEGGEMVTDNAPPMVTDNATPAIEPVKDEPVEIPDDESEENYLTPQVNFEDSSPNEPVNDADEHADDNTILNFELEPEVSITERRPARAAPTPVVENDDSSEDDNINWELAVVYICPACGAEFDFQDVWKRHINQVHNYNTRHGLNFVKIDKLYHECQECLKRIAMHAMENLLKHKFTHLPYRCTKCKICLRQYKYRQDLMVHLRMVHRDELFTQTKKQQAEQHPNYPIYNRNVHAARLNNRGSLEIRAIQGNAVAIYENTNDNILVKNELIEPDEREMNNVKKPTTSLLEDALSRSSSERHSSAGGGGGAAAAGNGNGGVNDDEVCEKYIQYICPQCGAEYGTQATWQQHIEGAHDFGTRKGLNFQEVNMNQHAQCLECNRLIYVNVIRNLQMHKFTHLPHKNWVRCKLCFRSFGGPKDIVNHLTREHRIGNEIDQDESQDMLPNFGGDDNDDDDSNMDQRDTSGKNEERDTFEMHIGYLCPQCGIEFLEKKLWRRHVTDVHQLADLHVLNFKIINDRQVMCNECDKIITNAYGIQNAQQHRITHMPYKSYIRCRMCDKSYTDRKGLVKHLRTVHRIGLTPPMGTAPSLQYPVYQRTQHKPPTVQPPKEIVRHKNYTFEIQFLEEDDDEAMISKASSAAEVSFTTSIDLMSRYKCVDCGSIFSTQMALQTHIKEEHEFLDYNTYKPTAEVANNSQANKRSYNSFNDVSNSSFGNNQSQDDQSSDADDLLMPTGDDDDDPVVSPAGGNIESYFCYLCPACGIDHRSQMDWRRHINEIHNFDKRHYLSFRPIDRLRHQCTICGDIVSNSKLKGLQDHKFRHLPYKLYIKCLICSTCYNHKPNMLSHLRMRHSIADTRTPEQHLNHVHTRRPSSPNARPEVRSYEALKPPSGLRTVEDCISYHNAVDHESITYFCPQCNANFDTHVFWRKHIVEEHNLNNRTGLNFRQIDNHHFLCLQCYKRVTVTHTKGAIGQLQSHKFRHLPYKSFKCLSCNGEFVRKQMFFKHLNKITNTCDTPRTAMLADITSANDAQHDVEEVATNNGDFDHDDNGEQTDNSDSQLAKINAYLLVCPSCGQRYDSWPEWRQHINSAHGLGQREMLRFKKLSPMLNQCLDCGEHVNGNRLRDLQIHKFKHLQFSAYLQCRFCIANYPHLKNMENHVSVMHNDYLQKYAALEQTNEALPQEDSDENDVEAIEVQPDYLDAEPEGDAASSPDADGDADADGDSDELLLLG